MLTPVLLSFGYDHTILTTRSNILRRAGYAVEEVYRWDDAHTRAQSDVIDAVLICHSVPMNEQAALISSIKNTRRLMPVFSVGSQLGPDESIERCVSVDGDPARLLDMLSEILFQEKKIA